MLLVEEECWPTLLRGQSECVWDDALPFEVKELSDDLAALDGLLSDHELPWAGGAVAAEFHDTRRAVLTGGRPTLTLETYARLMVPAALPVGVSDVSRLQHFGLASPERRRIVREIARSLRPIDRERSRARRCFSAHQVGQLARFPGQHSHATRRWPRVGRILHVRVDHGRVDPHRPRP